ncbi:acyltransferase domain-containing protein, partial [Actinomadura fibrosa]
MPWPVSARGEKALRAQAGRLVEHLAAHPEMSPAEVGWSLIKTRSAFEHRAVIAARDPRAGLEALATGQPHPDLVVGQVGPKGPGPVLVFPGQGSQWVGMGAQLLEQSGVFAARMAECEDALAPHVDWSLSQVIGGDGSELARVDVVQPVLWAIMVSLAAVWADHGVVPAAVIGHSQGEIAAACVAGALSLEDAARVVAVRSKALRQLSGGGAMASIGAGADHVQTLLDDTVRDDAAREAVQVAAVNSPSATVISGPPDQIQQVVTAAQEQGLRARVIDVDYASHGPQVDQITDHLTHALADITPTTTDTAFYSTVTGQRIDTTALDTAYWVTNLRRPVHFADTVDALLSDGYQTFIEASPHPVLTVGLEECFERAEATASAVPTLRRDHGGSDQVALALAHAHTVGTPIDWDPFFPADPEPRIVDLPSYAFQGERYWLEPPAAGRSGGAGDDPVEDRLWQAIEEEDVDALSDTLGLDGEDAVAALGPALPALSAWRREHRERRTIDSWRYEFGWKHVSQPAAPALTGTWLLLVPAAQSDHPAVHVASRAINAHGAVAVRHLLERDELERDALTDRLAELAAEVDPAGVVSLLALDEAPHPQYEAVPSGLSATTALIQAMTDTDTTAPLWCLTQGAVATTHADPLTHPTQAQIWGLGRVAALEHPKLWGGLIDLPTTIDQRTPDRLAALLTPGQPEDQAAIRPTGVLARRMRRAPATPATPPDWKPTGTTLITGGTGGIGAHLARWLAAN